MDAMLPRMMEAAGVTEELKARDLMRWVGLSVRGGRNKLARRMGTSR